jgi:sugar lactone lactonase YvrE
VKWTVYNTENSGLPFHYVNAIAIDGQGNKWIGTWGGGLAKFDGVTWTVFALSNSGLPSNIGYFNSYRWTGTNGLEHMVEGLQSLMV